MLVTTAVGVQLSAASGRRPLTGKSAQPVVSVFQHVLAAYGGSAALASAHRNWWSASWAIRTFWKDVEAE